MGVDKGCLTSTRMYAHSSIHSQASKPPQGCDPPHGPNQMAGAFSCNCRRGYIIDRDPKLDWWRECGQCCRQVGVECCWSGDDAAMCHWCMRWEPCYITSLPLEAEGWRHCVAAIANFLGGVVLRPPLPACNQAQVVLGQTCRSLHKWFSDKFNKIGGLEQCE